MTKKYMFDTNIINHLVDGEIFVDDLPADGERYITDIQHKEILQTPDLSRKNRLMREFLCFNFNIATPQTFLAGIGCAGYAAGNGIIFGKILNDLNDIKRRKNYSNVHDALIGEVVILSKMILVSSDKNFCEIVNSLEGMTKFYQIKKLYSTMIMMLRYTLTYIDNTLLLIFFSRGKCIQ
jgi:hypothetical protein